jgi:hypothetical protein
VRTGAARGGKRVSGVNGSGGAVVVSGREYRLPARPTVVMTVDGGDPRYFDDALGRGLTPADRVLWDEVRGG